MRKKHWDYDYICSQIYRFFFSMGKIQLIDATMELITFQLGTLTDIVLVFLEWLLNASEQQDRP